MGHFIEGASVLSLVIMISFQVPGTVAGRKIQKQAVPAIFVFGDGVLDVGNNNYLPLGDSDRADHPYYGIDFPNAKPTGRFSNGYNMADFIAKAMGFEMSPPAYLSLISPIKMEAGFTGVNYASADAGIWGIPNDEVIIPLSTQVDNFAATIGQMEDNMGQQKLSKLLSRSFFLISAGTMDLILIYRVLNFASRRSQIDPQHLVSSYGAVITSLYKMGARKFGIINIPPFGCAPDAMKPPYGPGRCNERKNNLAREFNDGLKPLLANLSSNLHGLRYSIADFYAFSNANFMNPSAYGFVNTYSECCYGSCVPSNPELHVFSPPPCDNRTQYWFWDSVYMTEQAAKLSAAAFYDGPDKFTVPINFKQLIQKK